MSERYTRKDVEAHFERFVKAIGGRVAQDSYHDEGAFRLDHAGTYGGYRIVRDSPGGGESTSDFRGRRFRPTAFIEMLSFAIDAIGARERNAQ